MRQFFFGLITIAFSFGLCEIALHALTKSSYYSAVNLLGLDLPPYRLILDTEFEKDINNKPSKGGKGHSDQISRGDLQGMIREDDVLGYTTLENATSKQGWASANNLGANLATPTAPAVPKGKKRILIFGESFSRGCGIPQKESWSALWQDRRPDLDIVNFGVSGYSMSLAYKRFELIDQKLDYDKVVFMFLPDVDTWRDINTMRQLGEGWGSFTIFPRYTVTDGKLAYVRGPYSPATDIYKENNPEHVTPKVINHLRENDAFYIPLLYESPPVIGSLITYKIIARLIGERQKKNLYLQQPQWNSAGMNVERHIFQSAKDLTQAKGKKFVLVLLPGPEVLENLRHSSDAKDVHGEKSKELKIWNEVVSGFRAQRLETLDLLPEMLDAPEDPDRGEDQAHYGRKTNALLARLIESHLSE